MVGNDIIDLAYTKKTIDYTRPRWLSKVCTASEIEAIKLSKDPFVTVWRMWSMKESAYKIYIQQQHRHALNPKYFVTSLINEKKGMVRYGTQILETCSKKTGQFISTVATAKDPIHASGRWGLSYPKQKIKETLLADIAKTHNYRYSALSLRSTAERVPFVYHNGEVLDLSISMSHHGAYAAYAYV